MLWIVREIPLRSILEKNLKVHAKRTISVAIIFELTVAFLIFLGAAVKNEVYLINNMVASRLGADLVATVYNGNFV